MPGVRKTFAPSESHAVVYDLATGRSRATTFASGGRAGSGAVGSAAPNLDRARQAVDAADEVRAARVQALREKIENGTYHPDPAQVAREILRSGL